MRAQPKLDHFAVVFFSFLGNKLVFFPSRNNKWTISGKDQAKNTQIDKIVMKLIFFLCFQCVKLVKSSGKKGNEPITYITQCNQKNYDGNWDSQFISTSILPFLFILIFGGTFIPTNWCRLLLRVFFSSSLWLMPRNYQFFSHIFTTPFRIQNTIQFIAS